MKKLVLKILYMVILIFIIACSLILHHFHTVSVNKEFTTGIKGQVFISPVSPVSKKGVLNKVPYEAYLILMSSNNEAIRKIQTEEDGKFEVALDAGNYTIIPETITKTGCYPIGEQKDIIIKSGQMALVEIDFDSGIR
jgi:hypothetical protein